MFSLTNLLKPLEEWRQANDEHMKDVEEQYEEITEEIQISRMHILNNKKLNLEQRAKVSLVNSIMPFIDRMIHEIKKLGENNESQQQREERYAYIFDLTKEINDYNDVLTRWIQMRQGELRLQIESFALQPLFNIVKKGRMGFQMKNVELVVEDTDAVVKADKTLTLFMINTIADNARKFTQSGGKVTIQSITTNQYVEISISDTGIGMNEEQLAHVFDHKPIIEESEENTVNIGANRFPSNLSDLPSHGFGLMNCKGIIEKYHRISQIFNVCTIAAESKQGVGSRFYFRLPKGVVRVLMALVSLTAFSSCNSNSIHIEEGNGISYDSNSALLMDAERYADSAYVSNINGNHIESLRFADSCMYCLNQHYKSKYPNGTSLMEHFSTEAKLPAELHWFRSEFPTNYNTILAVRNESAVAALALHRWDLYNYNNKVYTQLFREWSADNTLDSYCRMMKQSETNKTIAMIILVILMVMIFPLYYLMYYRHRLYYRFCVEHINSINNVLLSDASAENKLKMIDEEWNGKMIDNESHPISLENVVRQIRQALTKSIESEKLQLTNIEIASDELRKQQYENDNLHISNSVLDNTLSTLKHETMYYPSRIAHLVEGKDSNLQAISELVVYYKELYSMLSAQAMRQIEGLVHVDDDMLTYLFEILQKENQGEKPVREIKDKNDKYYTILVYMSRLHLTAEQCSQLFTSATMNVSYLLCKQIIRDIGAVASARGCGIRAYLSEKNQVVIEITIAKQIWNHSKLSS